MFFVGLLEMDRSACAAVLMVIAASASAAHFSIVFALEVSRPQLIPVVRSGKGLARFSR